MVPSTARDATHESRTNHTHTYLDLRRLEGGDAGDEGGREERGHRGDARVCENAARARAVAPRRMIRTYGIVTDAPTLRVIVARARGRDRRTRRGVQRVYSYIDTEGD